MSDHPHERSHGWCSLRLRFEARDLVLLRGAEHVRGTALAHAPRPGPTGLRSALTLAKAGHKLGAAAPGQSITLDEQEVALLVEALKFATTEVQWASRQGAQADPEVRVGTRPPSDDAPARRQAVLDAFPELVERGLWRGFGLSRELESLGHRLEKALTS